jgi:hypothetical protein
MKRRAESRKLKAEIVQMTAFQELSVFYWQLLAYRGPSTFSFALILRREIL